MWKIQQLWQMWSLWAHVSTARFERPMGVSAVRFVRFFSSSCLACSHNHGLVSQFNVGFPASWLSFFSFFLKQHIITLSRHERPVTFVRKVSNSGSHVRSSGQDKSKKPWVQGQNLGSARQWSYDGGTATSTASSLPTPVWPPPVLHNSHVHLCQSNFERFMGQLREPDLFVSGFVWDCKVPVKTVFWHNIKNYVTSVLYINTMCLKICSLPVFFCEFVCLEKCWQS